MKKKLFCGIMLLSACTILMVSCKKDKDEPQTPEQTTTQQTTVQPVGALLDYQFEVTDEMREVADFTISFYDKNGQLQTEQLTSNKWDTIIVTTLPAKLGVQVKAALKANFDATQYNTFRALKKYTYIAYAIDQNGKKIGTEPSFTNNTGTDMAADKIEGFFDKYKDKAFLQVLYTFDEKGNKTFLSTWE